MASGDTLFTWVPPVTERPTSNMATPDTRNNQAVEDFDAATAETVYVRGILDRAYGGGGVTLTVIWKASTATSGVCRWSVAIERQDTGTDQDADSFATANTVDSTASGTSGAPIYATIGFTHGAQMDSLAAGEAFRLQIQRAANHANDTMTGDAELVGIEIKET